MRILLVVALLACLLAGGCTGRARDPGRCADAFVRAMLARNLDDAMDLTGVPFLFVGQTAKGYQTELVESSDALRAKLKGTTGRPDAPDQLRVEVTEVVPAAGVPDRFGKKMTPETLAAIERVMGPDGSVVMFGRDGKPAGGVIVAIKGKAVVTGALP